MVNHHPDHRKAGGRFWNQKSGSAQGKARVDQYISLERER